MPRKPKPAATVSTGGIALIEPSPVHWGDTIHFAVTGDGLFQVRVSTVTQDGLTVAFTTATQGWSLTLGPSPTWPVDGDGNPVGGDATAALEGPPDANADHETLASTTFAVLP